MATDMQGNVVLLALDEVKQGSMPEDQKKRWCRGITQNNAQIVFEALMSNLRKEAKNQNWRCAGTAIILKPPRKKCVAAVTRKGRFRGLFHF
ncbi:hypothetical protein ACP0HM_34360 [Escherichia coli]